MPGAAALPPTDLRARRIALGAAAEVMATGIGIRLTELFEIERHQASDDALNHYAAWLSRMERWLPVERVRQYAAANAGRRFSVKT